MVCVILCILFAAAGYLVGSLRRIPVDKTTKELVANLLEMRDGGLLDDETASKLAIAIRAERRRVRDEERKRNGTTKRP